MGDLTQKEMSGGLRNLKSTFERCLSGLRGPLCPVDGVSGPDLE
jgi:hypothetical protein